MKDFLIFFLFFIIACSVSVTAGTFEYYRNAIRLRKFRRFFNKLTYASFLTKCIWALIGIFLCLGIYVKVFNGHVSRASVVGLFFFISILTILRLEDEYKLFKKFLSAPKIAVYLLSVTGIVITIITKSTIDGTISELTSSNAAAFPNAQHLLLLIFAPLIWIYFITIITFFFYTYNFISITLLALRNCKYLNNVYISFCFILKNRTSSRGAAKKSFHAKDYSYTKKNLDAIILDKAAIFCGLYVFIHFAIYGVPGILKSKDFQNQVTHLIVFSSFNVPSKSCQNVLYQNATLAFTWDDNISVATPISNDEYFFYVDTCERPIKKKDSG